MNVVVLVRRLLARPTAVDAHDVLGHCERAAISAGLRLAHNDGRVVAIAMGTARRQDRALREALQLGCTDAYRVYDSKLSRVSPVGAAVVLAAAARHVGFDLVLLGDQAQDWSGAALGGAVARELELPHIASVLDVGMDGTDPVVHVRTDGKRVVIRTPPPVVLSVRSFPGAVETRSSPGDVRELRLQELAIPSGRLSVHKGPKPRTSSRTTNALIADNPEELAAALRKKGLLAAAEEPP